MLANDSGLTNVGKVRMTAEASFGLSSAIGLPGKHHVGRQRRWLVPGADVAQGGKIDAIEQPLAPTEQHR